MTVRTTTTVTYEEYSKELKAFAKKHNEKGDMKVYSSLWEDDHYHKEYCWEDGATFYEVVDLITEMAEAEVHGIKVKVPVKLYRTEYWSTEAPSKYFYERA